MPGRIGFFQQGRQRLVISLHGYRRGHPDDPPVSHSLQVLSAHKKAVLDGVASCLYSGCHRLPAVGMHHGFAAQFFSCRNRLLQILCSELRRRLSAEMLEAVDAGIDDFDMVRRVAVLADTGRQGVTVPRCPADKFAVSAVLMPGFAGSLDPDRQFVKIVAGFSISQGMSPGVSAIPHRHHAAGKRPGQSLRDQRFELRERHALLKVPDSPVCCAGHKQMYVGIDQTGQQGKTG